MEVMDVLDRRTIRTGMKAENKAEVIGQMAQMFYDAGYLTDKEGYIKDVYVRESQGVTGIGDHIAIPHGKSESVSHVGVAIAVLDHEIEWESLDDTGAKVVILFAVGADNENAQEHLKMLAAFSGMLGRDEVLNALLNAKTTDDVVNAFSAEAEETDADDEEDFDLDDMVIA